VPNDVAAGESSFPVACAVELRLGRRRSNDVRGGTLVDRSAERHKTQSRVRDSCRTLRSHPPAYFIGEGRPTAASTRSSDPSNMARLLRLVCGCRGERFGEVDDAPAFGSICRAAWAVRVARRPQSEALPTYAVLRRSRGASGGHARLDSRAVSLRAWPWRAARPFSGRVARPLHSRMAGPRRALEAFSKLVVSGRRSVYRLRSASRVPWSRVGASARARGVGCAATL